MNSSAKPRNSKKTSGSGPLPRSEQTRRTNTDDIFDSIYADITTLRLKPGTKVSEVEIARQFDVSRQPVREAFIRLSNMGLLLVRPQRATVVKKISLKGIADSRFVRKAIEVEVARVACENFNASHHAAFEENLALQSESVADNDFQSFKELDAQFHRLLCLVADSEHAYRTISESKLQVDRLCAFALSRRTEFKDVYQDHVKMYELLKQGDTDGLVALMRKHLSRLDSTVAEATSSNQDFFVD